MALFIQLLQVGALVLFILAGINVNPPRVSLLGLGLACLTLAMLLGSRALIGG